MFYNNQIVKIVIIGALSDSKAEYESGKVANKFGKILNQAIAKYTTIYREMYVEIERKVNPLTALILLQGM